MKTMTRRIKSATTFDFRASNPVVALADFRIALEEACTRHPEIRSHRIDARGESLRISLELETDSSTGAEAIVLEVIEWAVAKIHGRITSDPEADRDDDVSATFEQLGTYLVPA